MNYTDVVNIFYELQVSTPIEDSYNTPDPNSLWSSCLGVKRRDVMPDITRFYECLSGPPSFYRGVKFTNRPPRLPWCVRPNPWHPALTLPRIWVSAREFSPDITALGKTTHDICGLIVQCYLKMRYFHFYKAFSFLCWVFQQSAKNGGHIILIIFSVCLFLSTSLILPR